MQPRSPFKPIFNAYRTGAIDLQEFAKQILYSATLGNCEELCSLAGEDDWAAVRGFVELLPNTEQKWRALANSDIVDGQWRGPKVVSLLRRGAEAIRANYQTNTG